MSEEAVVQQRASFNSLLQNLGEATFDEIEAVLAERNVVEPEVGLTPEVMMRLQKRLADKEGVT